jgi:hypothetical protein
MFFFVFNVFSFFWSRMRSRQLGSFLILSMFFMFQAKLGRGGVGPACFYLVLMFFSFFWSRMRSRQLGEFSYFIYVFFYVLQDNVQLHSLFYFLQPHVHIRFKIVNHLFIGDDALSSPNKGSTSSHAGG